MITYLFVLIVFFSMLNALRNEHDTLKRNRLEHQYVFFSCLILVVLAAIRYIIPYSDAETYMERYVLMYKISLKDAADDGEISLVYYVASKVFSWTGLPYQFWFGFVELLYIWSFIRMISKFTNDRIMCLLLFFTIGLYTFSFNGLKQTLAMAIIWFGFADFYEKKYVRALIMVVLAYFCHVTAMIFLLAFILLPVSSNKKVFNTVIVSLVAVLLIAYSVVISYLTNLLGNDRYIKYLDQGEQYSPTVLIFFITLLAIAYFTKTRHNQNIDENNSRFVEGLAVLAVFTQLFAFSIATAFRLALYFLPFLAVYLANKIEKNQRLQYYVFFITGFWLIYTSGVMAYRFYWD